MSDIDGVRFEEADDEGVELVFPDELLDVLGVSAGDEVEVRTCIVEQTDVQFEIDFGVEIDDKMREELEELLGDSLTIADS